MDGHVVIIGGGIAGLSAAYFLSQAREGSNIDSITLIESEKSLAYHTTGRSAALLTYNYGAGPIRPMSMASGPFMAAPPPGFADHPILSDRGILTVAEEKNHEQFDGVLAAGQQLVDSIVELDTSEAARIAPHIVFGDTTRAMWEPDAKSIDVAGLHQGYVRGARANGTTIATARRADAVRKDNDGSGWIVETTDGDLHADVVVNAAGAWGDHVAARANIEPVGLTPMIRTAFMVESRFDGSDRFPFVANALHDWYVGPDGPQFLCSPADEKPSEACDAKPEELDIAIAIDAINVATNLNITSVRSSWAGQRTFSPDRSMVIGPDPEHPTFVWCVGQGGTGIQTSPAAGQLVADIVHQDVLGDTSSSANVDGPVVNIGGLNRASLAPSRLRH